MYATGTAANPNALLSALETFATSAGWTIDRTTSVYNPGGGGGSPTDYWLAMHKGACYLNWVYVTSAAGVVLYPADGYNAAVGPAVQASVVQPASQSYMNIAGGPYTGYHFFSTTTSGHVYLHAVIEISGGIYGQLHGGILNAAGGASPAIYSTCTKWGYVAGDSGNPESGNNNMPWAAGTANNGSFVLVTVDGVLGWQLEGALATGGHRLIPAVRSAGFQNRGIHRTPNGYNELAVLFPCHCFAERASVGVWSYIGEPWDMRACNIQNINPKDEITIGSDVWKFFPGAAKSAVPYVLNNGVVSSGFYGYAFKKNG